MDFLCVLATFCQWYVCVIETQVLSTHLFIYSNMMRHATKTEFWFILGTNILASHQSFTWLHVEATRVHWKDRLLDCNSCKTSPMWCGVVVWWLLMLITHDSYSIKVAGTNIKLHLIVCGSNRGSLKRQRLLDCNSCKTSPSPVVVMCCWYDLEGRRQGRKERGKGRGGKEERKGLGRTKGKCPLP